ncbi:MAG: diguanylate cyclase [Acidobacteria bacterium]|nr:diguanylate cyclase [Acidobacteriota bacterium]
MSEKPAKLYWVAGGKEQSCALDESDVTMGRNETNQLILSGSSISREHARVFRKSGAFFLEDLGSSCGTFINGVRMQPNRSYELKSGDLLRIGKQQMQFLESDRRDAPELMLKNSLTTSISHEHLRSRIKQFRSELTKAFDERWTWRGPSKEARRDLDRSLEEISVYFESKFQEYRILQEITQVIAKILDLRELLTTTLELVSTVLSADRGFILMYDPDTKELRTLVNRFFDPQEPGQATPHDLSFSHTVAAKCLERREITLIEDALRDQRFEGAMSIMASTIRSVAAIPLISQSGDVMGVMYLDNLRRPGCFHDHQLEFMETLATQISIAFENARLYTEAVTDDLTGLYNRKLLDARIREEIRKSRRQMRPCSLLLLDIDHFKKVNDTYGHLQGDKVLVRIAEVLRNAARFSDVVARYGGEEFIMLLPGTDRKGATTMAERVRSAIEETPVPMDEGTVSVTASVGVASYDGSYDLGTKALIKAADTVLYRAKESGRNRVLICEEPIVGSPSLA